MSQIPTPVAWYQVKHNWIPVTVLEGQDLLQSYCGLVIKGVPYYPWVAKCPFCDAYESGGNHRPGIPPKAYMNNLSR